MFVPRAAQRGVRHPIQMIKNKELVTSHFGYWPEFADGKVMRLTFDYSGDIEIVVHYIDAEKQKSGNIGLRFG